MQPGYGGLGNRGAALARRLLRNDKRRFYDLRPQMMSKLAPVGGIARQNPKAVVAHCDVVMRCLAACKKVHQAMPVCHHVRAILHNAVNELGREANFNSLMHLHERQSKAAFAPKG